MRKTVSWWIRPCQPFTILEGKDGFRHFSGDLGQGLFKSDKRNNRSANGRSNIEGAKRRMRKRRMIAPIPNPKNQHNRLIVTVMRMMSRKMSQASLNGSRTRFLMKCVI
jgi:hypothetical protein